MGAPAVELASFDNMARMRSCMRTAMADDTDC